MRATGMLEVSFLYSVMKGGFLVTILAFSSHFECLLIMILCENYVKVSEANCVYKLLQPIPQLATLDFSSRLYHRLF